LLLHFCYFVSKYVLGNFHFLILRFANSKCLFLITVSFAGPGGGCKYVEGWIQYQPMGDLRGTCLAKLDETMQKDTRGLVLIIMGEIISPISATAGRNAHF